MDLDHSNDTPSNLVLCNSASYHALLHKRTNELRLQGRLQGINFKKPPRVSKAKLEKPVKGPDKFDRIWALEEARIKAGYYQSAAESRLAEDIKVYL